MIERKAYFVSDIHLESMEERNGQNLLRFLRFLNTQDVPVDLYFMGDIFDFWLSDHKVFVEKFKDLYPPLIELKSKGSRLVFFEGNHDIHIKPYWQKKLGFKVYKKAHYEKIGNLQVRLEHGDLINLEDHAYLKWKAFTQNPINEFLAHRLPGRFWDWLGRKLSEKSRARSFHFRVENEESIKEMIRHHAHRSFLEKPFDLIITGHMHVKVDEVFDVNGKISRNINLGTWRGEEDPPILCIEGSRVSWLTTP
jgi:UDP-2,3-diacylglucosamine hydrolase